MGDPIMTNDPSVKQFRRRQSRQSYGSPNGVGKDVPESGPQPKAQLKPSSDPYEFDLIDALVVESPSISARMPKPGGPGMSLSPAKRHASPARDAASGSPARRTPRKSLLQGFRSASDQAATKVVAIKDDPYEFPDSPVRVPAPTPLLPAPKPSPIATKPAAYKGLSPRAAQEPGDSGRDSDEPPARRHMRTHWSRTARVQQPVVTAQPAMGGASVGAQAGDAAAPAQPPAVPAQPQRRPPRAGGTPQQQPVAAKEAEVKADQVQAGKVPTRPGCPPHKGPVAAAAAAAAAAAVTVAVAAAPVRKGASHDPVELDHSLFLDLDLGRGGGRARAQPASQPLPASRAASPMHHVAKTGKAAHGQPAAAALQRAHSAPASPARPPGVQRSGVLLPSGGAGPVLAEGPVRRAVVGSAPAELGAPAGTAGGTGRVRFGPDVALSTGGGAGKEGVGGGRGTGGGTAGFAGVGSRHMDLEDLPADTPIVVEAEQPGGKVLRMTMSTEQLRKLMGGQGLAALGIRRSQAGDEAAAAAAHSVMEAQERGEIMMLHDDAIYYYDGLAPGKPLATRREAAVRLAEMMATARGRAALRPDSYTQKVLSACAKLQGARDPVLCLCFCTMLLGAAAPDVNPAYLGSHAACVLISQLVQVECCDLSDPAAVSEAMCVYEVDTSSPGCRPRPEPVLFERVMRAVTYGPLRRQLLSWGLGEAALSPLRSHMPLMAYALRAAVHVEDEARAAAKAEVVAMTRHTLRKIGVLEKVAGVVHKYVGRVGHELQSAGASGATVSPSAATTAARGPSKATRGSKKYVQAGKVGVYDLPESDSDGKQSDMEEEESVRGLGQADTAGAGLCEGCKGAPGGATAGGEQADSCVAGLLAEVRSLTDALIALTFKCPDNQQALYTARVGGDLGPLPTGSQQGKPTSSTQSQHTAAGEAGEQLFLQSVMQLVAVLSQPLRSELSSTELAAGTAGGAAAGVGQQRTWGEPVRAECALAWQSAADLLLNLTMNEPHCVAAAVEGGALELMGGCLAMFCKAAPAAGQGGTSADHAQRAGSPAGGRSRGKAGAGAAAISTGSPSGHVQKLHDRSQQTWCVCRASMLLFARPTTSAMCCLLNCINCTEADPAHVSRFLNAPLAPPATTHTATPQPIRSQRGALRTTGAGAVWGSGAAGSWTAAAVPAVRAVPLLCAILCAVHEDAAQQPSKSSKPSGAGVPSPNASWPPKAHATASAAAAADAYAAAAATKTFGRGASRRSGGAPHSGAAAQPGSQVAGPSQPIEVACMDLDAAEEKLNAPTGTAPAEAQGPPTGAQAVGGAGQGSQQDAGEEEQREEEQGLEASWVRCYGCTVLSVLVLSDDGAWGEAGALLPCGEQGLAAWLHAEVAKLYTFYASNEGATTPESLAALKRVVEGLAVRL